MQKPWRWEESIVKNIRHEITLKYPIRIYGRGSRNANRTLCFFFFDGAVLFLYNAITIGRLIKGNRTGEIENAVFIHCSREFSGWMFALESPIFQLKIKRDYVTVFVRVTCRLSRIFTAVCHFFSENNF